MSDEELRERIELDWLWLTHTCSTAEQKSVDRTLDKMVQLITADRKRAVLEARIDELEHTFVSYDNALASELVENPEWEYGQVAERIAELKAQQEEV